MDRVEGRPLEGCSCSELSDPLLVCSKVSRGKESRESLDLLRVTSLRIDYSSAEPCSATALLVAMEVQLTSPAEQEAPELDAGVRFPSLCSPTGHRRLTSTGHYSTSL